MYVPLNYCHSILVPIWVQGFFILIESTTFAWIRAIAASAFAKARRKPCFFKDKKV
ncbi:hypothetical protein SRRS_09280 [Sporomusa rhizae]